MGSIKTSIVRIGNSQGVRIPKVLVEQCGLLDELELIPAGDHLIIKPLSRPRRNWETKLKDLARRGDDRLLGGEVDDHSQWDEDEWEWS